MRPAERSMAWKKRPQWPVLPSFMRVRSAEAISTTQVVVGYLGSLLSGTLWTRRGGRPMMQSDAFSFPIVITAETLLWRRLLSQMLERLETNGARLESFHCCGAPQANEGCRSGHSGSESGI